MWQVNSSCFCGSRCRSWELPQDLQSLQTVNYVDATEKDFRKLIKALKNIPSSKPFPDPYPEEPKIPVLPFGQRHKTGSKEKATGCVPHYIGLF